MNDEILQQALYPNVSPGGDELLRRVVAAAREQALDVITYALARREAKELATALEPTLQREQEEAAPHIAAAEAAAAAVAREEGSIASRLAAYFKRAAAGKTPDEAEPSRVSSRLQQLRIDLAAAEAAAAPYRACVRHREDQIAALRHCPRPDRAAQEALGMGVNVGCLAKTEEVAS